MELIKLNEEVYNAFASKHAYANFLNSIYSGKKFQKKGWTCDYIGLVDKEEIKAATLLVSTPLRNQRYFYAPRGFLLDFNDQQLLQEFVSQLKEYMSERNALYLKIDPYVPYQERDLNGKKVEGGFKEDQMIDNLKSCGFEHLGFTKGYDDSTQCRWMSVLDLKGKNEETLLKEMNSQTRQNIKNTIKTGIKVRKLSYEELPILKDIVNATSERRGFADLSLEYYQEEYEVFKEHAQAYYAYLDLEDYQARIDKEKEEEEEIVASANATLLENPHSKNSKKRLQSANQKLESLMKRQKELNDLKKEHEKEVPLAAAMFIKYGDEIIYLTSGSYDQYKRFKGPYAMQWYMICMALKEGYSYYNFYGISGLFEKEEDGYGVFDFKRGFKAEVVELLGDFILPVNKVKYKIYNAMRNAKKVIKK